jgi:outer membrane autotransporter protein
MKRRKVSIAILLAFLSWVPSARGAVTPSGYTGAEDVSTTATISYTDTTVTPNVTYTLDAGISSSTDIIIPGLSGNVGISSGANFFRAGLAANNITIGTLASPNGLTGNVTVTSGNNQSAGGLASFNDLTIYGNLSRKVSATVGNGKTAYGIFAKAIGLSAMHDITITGDISGDVTSLAGNTEATAAGFSAINNINLNNLSGKVSAISGTTNARVSGMEAGKRITFAGDLSGTITATDNANGAITGGLIAGTFADNIDTYTALTSMAVAGDVAVGTMSGTIATTVGNNGYAFGILSGNDISINNLSGHISSIAGTGSGPHDGWAFGAGAWRDLTIAGDLSGTITTTAGDGGTAAGMFAYKNLTINNLSGTVNATAGNQGWALGLIGGAITSDGTSSITINNLSGSVNVTAGTNGTVTGLLSDRLTINDLSGTVQAIAGAGGEAYAICSGRLDDPAGAGAHSGNDSITLTGRLVGNVFLGAGNDVFTLKGHADISGVPHFDGGAGTDSLVLDGWTGSLTGVSFAGWESTTITGSTTLTGEVTLPANTSLTVTGATNLTGVTTLNGGGGTSQLTFTDATISLTSVDVSGFPIISLTSGALVNVGSATDPLNPKTISFTNGLIIDGTSTLQTAGSSPGYYNLVGNVTNNGTIRLLDNLDAEDRLTITGNYTGTGAITFDVNTNAGKSDQVIITGNATGSTKLVVNELSVPTSPSTPLLLVSVAGTKDAGAFTAGEYIAAHSPKIYNFTLTQDGDNYSLSALNFERYREEAALLQGMSPFAQQLGFESVSGFRERLAHQGVTGGGQNSGSYWLRAYGNSYAIGQTGDAATTLKGYSGGTQFGADLFSGGTGSSSQYHIGAYAGAGWQNADVNGIIATKAGKLSQNAIDVGLYANVAHSKDKYLEGIVQVSHRNIDISSPDEPASINTHAWGLISSIEGGVKVPVSNSFTLEPQVQFIYQHTGSLQFTTVLGGVTVDNLDCLRSRLGLNGSFTNIGVPFIPFFDVTLIKDISNDAKVVYAGDNSILNSKPEATQFGGAIGIASAKSNQKTISYYAKAGALYGIDGGRNSYNYTLMAGVTMPF